MYLPYDNFFIYSVLFSHKLIFMNIFKSAKYAHSNLIHRLIFVFCNVRWCTCP